MVSFWNEHCSPRMNHTANMKCANWLFLVLFVCIASFSYAEASYEPIFNFQTRAVANLTCPLKNDTAPSTPTDSLGTCSRYQGNACCDPQDVQDLENWLEENQVREIYSQVPQCMNLVNSLYCGIECAPYQQEFINYVTGNSTGNSTAGNSTNTGNGTNTESAAFICDDFCRNLYTTCYNVRLMSTFTVGTLYTSHVSFCRALEPDYLSFRIVNSSTCYNGRDKPTSPPDSCQSSGSGLVGGHRAGTNQDFSFRAVDIYGNNQTEGGDLWNVTLSGPAVVNGTVTDSRNGSYLVQYNAPVSGNYTLEVLLGNSALCNSPFNISVLPRGASDLSYLICGGTYPAGDEVSFTIVAVDDLGNVNTLGGDVFQVLVVGPATVVATVIDNKDGTYTASLCPNIPGEYTIQVSIDGEEIQNSTCQLFITGGFDVSESEIFGEVQQACTASPVYYFFTIEDSAQVPMNLTQSQTVSVRVKDTTTQTYLAKSVSIEATGLYRIAFNASSLGPYEIDVQVDGARLSNSPYTTTMLPGPYDLTKTITAGPGTLPSQYNGQRTFFTVTLRDSCSNRATEAATLNISISSMTGPQVIPASVTQGSDSVYTIAYVPSGNGSFLVQGNAISPRRGSLFSNFVFHIIENVDNATTCPECSIAMGVGLRETQSAFLNEFFVQARSCEGVDRLGGGDSFLLSLSYKGIEVSPSYVAEDLGNGLYRFYYDSGVYGEADLTIFHNDGFEYKEIGDDPHTIFFTDGTPCGTTPPCSGNGLCYEGACMCLPGFSGSDCTAAGTTINHVSLEGNGLVLRIDYAQSIGSVDEEGCSEELLESILPLLGSDPRCQWTSATELVVALGNDAVFNQTHFDQLQAGVDAEYELPEPVVRIIGPSMVSPCVTEFVLDVSASLGHGGRPFAGIQWDAEDNAALDAFLQNIRNLKVTIPVSLLPEDATTTIEVSLMNIFGFTSTSSIDIYYTTAAVPVVTIQAPSELEVPSWIDFQLPASVEIGSCGSVGTTTVSYAWKGSPEVTLDLESSVRKNLYLPAGTLPAGTTVTLELSASINGNLVSLGRDTVQVHALLPANFAVVDIRRGDVTSQVSFPAITMDKCTTGRLRAVSLDASSSFHTVSSSMDWGCNYDDTLQDIVLDGDLALNIPAGRLHADTYQFEFEVILDSGDSDVASLEVAFVDGLVPDVYIEAIGAEVINPGQKLVLHGKAVSQDSSAAFTYQWKILPEGLLDLSDTSVTPTSTADSLVIFGGVLKPYVTYRFVLEAEDAFGVGSAEISFTVNPPPLGGMFTVSPDTGVAGSTEFELIADSWDDAEGDYPLQYFYGFINQAGALVPLVPEVSFSNRITAVLPAGISGVYVQVFDKHGAAVVATANVTVGNPLKKKQTTDPATEIINGALANAVASANVEEITQQLHVVMGILNSNESSAATETNTNNRYEIASILKGGFPVGDTDRARLLVAQLAFSASFVPEEINQESQLVLLEVVESLLTGSFAEQSDAVDFGSLAVGTLSNILDASQVTGLPSDDFIGRFFEALKIASLITISQSTENEPPVVFERASFSIQTVRRATEDTERNQTVAGCAVSLPASLVSIVRNREVEVVDSVFIVFSGTNPRFYSNSSANINSPVVLFELSDAEDGTVLRLKNLGEPVEISIPKVNHSLNENTFCQSWNEDKGKWSRDGCSLSEDSPRDTAMCLCTHLSEFSVREKLIPIFGSPYIEQWWLILGFGGAAILTLVAFIIAKNRKSTQTPEELLEDQDAKEEAEAMQKQALKLKMQATEFSAMPFGYGQAQPLDEDIFLDRTYFDNASDSDGSVKLKTVSITVPPEDSSSSSESEKSVDSDKSEEEVAVRPKRTSKVREDASDREGEVKKGKPDSSDSSSESEEMKRTTTNSSEQTDSSDSS